jgi:hypothetical protein
MSRFLTKWALAAVLGTAGWLASSGPAAAQYPPAFGGFRSPGFNPFFGSPFLGSPYLMGPYNYSFANPFTGGVFNYQYSPYGGVSGYSFTNPFTGQLQSYQAYVPYYMAAGYGGGYGGYAAPYAASAYSGAAAGAYGTSRNPVINQQLRQLRAASYQNAYPSGGYDDARSYMSPRWTTAASEKAAGKPADVNQDLLKASEKDIHSGQALNALVAEIRKLVEKGAKAEAPLLPAEVVTRIAYERSAEDAKDAPPAVAPKWGSMGATVTELLRHMESNKFRFAPAPAGAGEAYGAVYRGLSGYYVALASAKK